MSWLSMFVIVFVALVSTLAAISISFVIVLVLGQALLLAYRALVGRMSAPGLVSQS